MLAKMKDTNFTAVNVPMSLKLANEVIASDPTNSAGYLLKARILNSQNKTQDAQKILDLAEEKTDHYDSYMLTLKRKMFEVTEGAADIYAGFDFELGLLTVSAKVVRIITKYKKVKLGEQIMKPAFDDTMLLPELEWSSWDYQNAKYATEEMIPGRIYQITWTFTHTKIQS